MFALAPRSRTYPVLLPDRPSAEREPARRRTRRRPLPTIVAVAVIAVLPAVTLVSQRPAAAAGGGTADHHPHPRDRRSLSIGLGSPRRLVHSQRGGRGRTLAVSTGAPPVARDTPAL